MNKTNQIKSPNCNGQLTQETLFKPKPSSAFDNNAEFQKGGLLQADHTEGEPSNNENPVVSGGANLVDYKINSSSVLSRFAQHKGDSRFTMYNMSTN